MIWITAADLYAQVDGPFATMLLENKAESSDYYDPAEESWYGFPPGTKLENGSLLRVLDGTTHGKPAKMVENSGNGKKDTDNGEEAEENTQLWHFHVAAGPSLTEGGAVEAAKRSNWDLEALKSRIEENYPAEVTAAENTTPGLFDSGSKQANVVVRVPKSWDEYTVKDNMITAINHRPITTPKITKLDKADGPHDLPKTERVSLVETLKKLKWVGIAGVGVYALSNLSYLLSKFKK